MSLDEGQSFIDIRPDSEASQAFIKIVDKISEAKSPA